MKLMTVAVPSYNSEDYLSHAIETLLTGGDELEIIIINDGSNDNTLKIAQEYQKEYPDMVRVISQENGGHGEGVNTGLANARGMYYKVVDSDDWVDEKALKDVMIKLKELIADNKAPDLFIVNYVYEKVGAKRKKVMRYDKALPKDKIFTWDDIMHFRINQYILMHSAIYRTKLLKDCGVKLPKHTFYVDNILVYYPLPFVKTMYYMDVDFYRYFIGRDDQSVNEDVMTKRIDQQIKITRIMVESHNLSKVKNKKLQKYMINYLTMMMTICSVFLIREGSEESLKKKEDLWDHLKEDDQWVHKKIKSKFLGWAMHLPGKTGRKIVRTGYSVAKKIYKFN